MAAERAPREQDTSGRSALERPVHLPATKRSPPDPSEFFLIVFPFQEGPPQGMHHPVQPAGLVVGGDNDTVTREARHASQERFMTERGQRLLTTRTERLAGINVDPRSLEHAGKLRCVGPGLAPGSGAQVPTPVVTRDQRISSVHGLLHALVRGAGSKDVALGWVRLGKRSCRALDALRVRIVDQADQGVFHEESPVSPGEGWSDATSVSLAKVTNSRASW